jgi:hypothetical protein
MNKIEESLENFRYMGDYLNQIKSKLNFDMCDKRERIFIDFFNITLVHYNSVEVLIRGKLYPSALVLVRVIFESIVRADYIYYISSDEEIESLYQEKKWNGREFKKMKEMCTDLDEKLNTEYYSDIKNKAWEAMNDYTHTGQRQIARSAGNDYDESFVLDVLNHVYSLFYAHIRAMLGNIGLKYNSITQSEIDNFWEKYKLK